MAVGVEQCSHTLRGVAAMPSAKGKTVTRYRDWCSWGSNCTGCPGYMHVRLASDFVLVGTSTVCEFCVSAVLVACRWTVHDPVHDGPRQLRQHGCGWSTTAQDSA